MVRTLMTQAPEESQESRWPGRLAVGVLQGDPPEVFLASSVAVLGRLLALHVVARADPEAFRRVGTLDEVRTSLLEERWADALVLWMDATESIVDGYPDEIVWSDARIDAESTAFELRMSPVFRDVSNE